MKNLFWKPWNLKQRQIKSKKLESSHIRPDRRDAPHPFCVALIGQYIMKLTVNIIKQNETFTLLEKSGTCSCTIHPTLPLKSFEFGWFIINHVRQCWVGRQMVILFSQVGFKSKYSFLVFAYFKNRKTEKNHLFDCFYNPKNDDGRHTTKCIQRTTLVDRCMTLTLVPWLFVAGHE